MILSVDNSVNNCQKKWGPFMTPAHWRTIGEKAVNIILNLLVSLHNNFRLDDNLYLTICKHYNYKKKPTVRRRLAHYGALAHYGISGRALKIERLK